MAKVSDCKVKERINNILRHKPYASTLYIKQRQVGTANFKSIRVLSPTVESAIVSRQRLYRTVVCGLIVWNKSHLG